MVSPFAESKKRRRELKPIAHQIEENGLYDASYEHDNCGVAFIVHMKGAKSHSIVHNALTALERLEHRGACGCEENTGDGAGILIQIPHKFFKKTVSFSLPEEGQYGAGLIFLPQHKKEREKAIEILQTIIQDQGQVFLGLRELPIEEGLVGKTASDAMPYMAQVFVGVGPKGPGLPGDGYLALNRRLFVIRKAFENAIYDSNLAEKKSIYLPTLSCTTIVYKGMLISNQVEPFFHDLQDPQMESALALVHSRFSTNTFPSWELAQPFRYLCHNGEINTVRGNFNWVKAREALFQSKVFGDELDKVLPICRLGRSDSATLDNVLEMLVMAGYTLPHAIMMMIPEAWSGHQTMPQWKKDFYEYHATLMEPWDGPASIPFTDGRVIGAVLDRNGLRPSRYWVTSDDLVIMASEVGVVDVDTKDIVQKGRLEPGRMFLVDMNEGRIVKDQEVKEKICKANPYGQWLKKEMKTLADFPKAKIIPTPDHDTLLKRQKVFGYTLEDQSLLMEPMAKTGVEAIGSMGNDAPLAVLSDRPQTLFNYFKQLFAQVTNPPLDAIREELVTSIGTTIGSERNLLHPTPESCHHIKLDNPILNNESMAQLKDLENHPTMGFKSKCLSILFNDKDGTKGMKATLDKVFEAAKLAILDGANIIILSDRGVDETQVPIPSLLATAGLHHYLVREGLRARAAIVVESGEPREVHHFCLLVGYGAGAINPYVAFETLDDMIKDKILTDTSLDVAIKNYQKSVKKGIVKVMSKIGISTIQSYRGAQIFEAVGINRDVIDEYFTLTASRIKGIGLEEICQEALIKHRHAFPQRYSGATLLDWGGRLQMATQ